MTGIELIAAERERQVIAENWTPAHDDSHSNGEIAAAAACYANPLFDRDPRFSTPNQWPWDAKWWKPNYDYVFLGIRTPIGVDLGGRIRDLAKAGALIAAEIDRLQRIK
jgi:hypothetical protein